MSRLSTKLAPAKNFVARHKTALTITATTLVTAKAVSMMQKGALREAYDFIDAAGLTEKFVDSVPYNEIYS